MQKTYGEVRFSFQVGVSEAVLREFYDDMLVKFGTINLTNMQDETVVLEIQELEWLELEEEAG